MKSLIILWKNGPIAGVVRIHNGAVSNLRVSSDEHSIDLASFQLSSSVECRLIVEVESQQIQLGSHPTIVSIASERNPFTFLLRDVTHENPIYIPEYGVIVTENTDDRTYDQIEAHIRQRGLKSVLEQIEADPEETYESAAEATRSQLCPTWLGISRDIRIFEIGYREHEGFWGYIKARWHNDIPSITEAEGKETIYQFVVGRGAGCITPIRRRLEDGYLPILESHIQDDDIHYELTAFVTLEKSALLPRNVQGTDFLVADGHSAGHMFTEEQQAAYDKIHLKEESKEEETVLCLSIKATNTAEISRYAWIKSIFPVWKSDTDHCSKTGVTRFRNSGRAFCVSRLNGRPMPKTDVALLLKPGETSVIECFVPHRPIEPKRAEKLAGTDFQRRKKECREFWLRKLKTGASIQLPEPVIQEMVNAGLIHLDLITYGKEPDGTLAATIGIYSPIGSESAPIIQFFDSMGWHGVARRSLQYFLDKQHEDGFMQNFGGYMLETGAALWSMGEHYRYTRDEAWVEQIRPAVVKACEFILAWRNRNMKPELRESGFGMLDGKVADPEDPFHSFMLNGYAYLGMQRVSEMLEHVSPKEAKRWAKEAEQLKNDIMETFLASMARSPVIPLGDGTWVPTCPPWPESPAPVALLIEPERCWTHGTFTARDSLLGPLYLVFQEVIDPSEQAADFLAKSNAELFCTRNVAFSQPYYCRNAWVHVKRAEAKAFLKTYYNGLTGLADRETHSWWEHYHHASPHKTHEEAWFLMQTRWMLWLEEGKTLNLLRGVPRSWFETGKRIELTNVASYFGQLNLTVHSNLVSDSNIEATIECKGSRQPKDVIIRIPHPDGKMAISVEGGLYDSNLESVRITGFKNRARIILTF